MKVKIIYRSFIFVMLISSLNAGVNLTCAGARAAGMGGDCIGIADDVTAFTSIPIRVGYQNVPTLMIDVIGNPVIGS